MGKAGKLISSVLIHATFLPPLTRENINLGI